MNPDDARAELVEAMAKSKFRNLPNVKDRPDEWDRANASAVVDALLAHPSTLIAALGGEQVGWQYAHDMNGPLVNLRQAAACADTAPVYRFPALEDK